MTKKSVIILIFSIAFLVRLVCILNFSQPLAGDECAYDNLALRILNEHKYYVESDQSSRPPGYPFLLSAIYFIFGHNFNAVRIFQALFDSLMCVLMYVLCSRLFSKRIALTAGIFSVLYFLFIQGASRLLTESIETFMLFLLIFIVYKTKERFSFFNAVSIGLLGSMLALTKGIMVLFLPFLFLGLLVLGYYRNIALRELLKKILIVAVIFTVPISLWTCRNYKVYKAFVPVSTQSGWALYDSYFPREGKKFGFNIIDDNVRYAMSLNSPVEMSNYLTKKTLEFIRNNPAKVLKLEFLKILYFWSPIDWEIIGAGAGNGVFNFQYAFIFPFSVFGVFLLLKNMDRHVPLYCPIIYMFFMCLIFYGSSRFRMAIEPYLIIFFAVGIVKFFELFIQKSKYMPAVISASYGFLILILYFNFNLFKTGAVSCFKFFSLW